MMLRKREEVCGKPTQYNLQTLEYDWKELPDTHLRFQGTNRRRGGAEPPYAVDDGYRGPSNQFNQFQPAVNDGDRGFGSGAEEVVLPPWNHDDIRQMLRSNWAEANRSYLNAPAQ